jgi:hypothetical protein
MAQEPTVPRANFTTGMQNSTQGAVLASTPPSSGAVAEGVGSSEKYKYYFYCSPPTLNSIVNYSKRVQFRNHFYRTNDDEEARFIREELMNRGDTLAYKVEEVDEKEFLKRISLPEQGMPPPHPGEGIIEPFPGQDTTRHPPPGEAEPPKPTSTEMPLSEIKGSPAPTTIPAPAAVSIEPKPPAPAAAAPKVEQKPLEPTKPSDKK